jgi:hypothetical protein
MTRSKLVVLPVMPGAVWNTKRICQLVLYLGQHFAIDGIEIDILKNPQIDS